MALRLTEVGAFQVDLVSESEFGEECLPQVDGVFTMARSPRVLSVLAAAESRGVPVWNSARGVQGLSRRGVNDMGRKLGVSVPPSVAVSGNGGVPVGHMAYPCWLKRDDACAQQSDDIHFVTNDAEWRAAVEDFTRRGIREYVAEKHLKGDVLKFYGVAGTGFFFCYYPTDEHGFSKFGLEHINGAAKGFLFGFTLKLFVYGFFLGLPLLVPELVVLLLALIGLVPELVVLVAEFLVVPVLLTCTVGLAP